MDGPLNGNQTSPISGRLADYGLVLTGGRVKHPNISRPNTVIGSIINQEKSELKPTQVFSFVGYEYPLHLALEKTTRERWLKFKDLILRLKQRLGRSLRAKLSKRSVVRQKKRLHINVLELTAVPLALRKFKDKCQNQQYWLQRTIQQ